MADLCTASGCIACSVAYEHPLARVVATDIVPEAVALARDNVAALELGDRVEVLSCDLGEGVDPTLMGAFDLVVSNPPYVPTAVMDDIPREVAEFEPALALDGGADGLDVLRRLLPWCRRALKEGGGFAFELHETCLDEAARLAEEGGAFRCSRHGRSRRAPPRPHRPKARRVDGSSGRRGFRASPGASGRTRRPARAGQAYALPVARFRPRMCGKNEVLAVIGRFPAPSSKDAEAKPQVAVRDPCKTRCPGGRFARQTSILLHDQRNVGASTEAAASRKIGARGTRRNCRTRAEPAEIAAASVRPSRTLARGRL